MKNGLYILTAVAVLAALTACEPKYEYSKESFVVMNETSVSIAEDVDTLVLKVTAYPADGNPDTEVSFDIIDGTGDNGAKNGVDFTVISPVNGVLTFAGDSTATIMFRMSKANVGIYTGRKQFKVTLTGLTNGYILGGAYSTTVNITDVDKNIGGNAMAGIWSVTGGAYENGDATVQTWEMKIAEDELNSEILYLDGLVPYTVGWYDSYGTSYCAQGYLSDDESKLIIPTQMLDNVTSSGYYLGYAACIQYDGDGGFYYNASWPDVTFTHDETTDTWVSDYGFFLMGCTENDISTFAAFFDVDIPGLVITKIE